MKKGHWSDDEIILTLDAHVEITEGRDRAAVIRYLVQVLNREDSAVSAAVRAVAAGNGSWGMSERAMQLWEQHKAEPSGLKRAAFEARARILASRTSYSIQRGKHITERRGVRTFDDARKMADEIKRAHPSERITVIDELIKDVVYIAGEG